MINTCKEKGKAASKFTGETLHITLGNNYFAELVWSGCYFFTSLPPSASCENNPILLNGPFSYKALSRVQTHGLGKMRVKSSMNAKPLLNLHGNSFFIEGHGWGAEACTPSEELLAIKGGLCRESRLACTFLRTCWHTCELISWLVMWHAGLLVPVAPSRML
jgi:hypothetical protein